MWDSKMAAAMKEEAARMPPAVTRCRGDVSQPTLARAGYPNFSMNGTSNRINRGFNICNQNQQGIQRLQTESTDSTSVNRINRGFNICKQNQQGIQHLQTESFNICKQNQQGIQHLHTESTGNSTSANRINRGFNICKQNQQGIQHLHTESTGNSTSANRINRGFNMCKLIANYLKSKLDTRNLMNIYTQ